MYPEAFQSSVIVWLVYGRLVNASVGEDRPLAANVSVYTGDKGFFESQFITTEILMTIEVTVTIL